MTIERAFRILHMHGRAKFWMKESNTELNCTLCDLHHALVGILLFLSHHPSSNVTCSCP